MAREAKDPVTLSTLARFRQALDKAESIEQALTDPRVLKVLMPALGLPDQVGNPGLVRRALLSDPADPKGLAAQLGAAWKSAAATLGAHAAGLDALRDPAMVQRLTDAYVKYAYRSGLDEQQAGLSDALYFLDSAGRAERVFDILGDPVLRRVVTGALGLPEQIAVQSVEAQGRAVTARLKMETLKDERAVRKLAEQYGVSRTPFVPGDENEKCILCGLCVRVCRQVSGAEAISLGGRGEKKHLGLRPLEEFPTACIGCGACSSVCPTGAISMEEKAVERLRSAWGERRRCRYALLGILPGALCESDYRCAVCEIDQRMFALAFPWHPAFLRRLGGEKKP